MYGVLAAFVVHHVLDAPAFLCSLESFVIIPDGSSPAELRVDSIQIIPLLSSHLGSFSVFDIGASRSGPMQARICLPPRQG